MAFLKMLVPIVGLLGLLLLANSGEALDILETGKKIGKFVQGAERIRDLIYEATGDSGSINIQGRTLHYKVKGGFYKWEYQYTGKAWDEGAGISVKSKGWQSADGAREHALEDLVAELKKLGLLK